MTADQEKLELFLTTLRSVNPNGSSTELFMPPPIELVYVRPASSSMVQIW